MSEASRKVFVLLETREAEMVTDSKYRRRGGCGVSDSVGRHRRISSFGSPVFYLGTCKFYVILILL